MSMKYSSVLKERNKQPSKQTQPPHLIRSAIPHAFPKSEKQPRGAKLWNITTRYWVAKPHTAASISCKMQENQKICPRIFINFLLGVSFDMFLWFLAMILQKHSC